MKPEASPIFTNAEARPALAKTAGRASGPSWTKWLRVLGVVSAQTGVPPAPPFDPQDTGLHGGEGPLEFLVVVAHTFHRSPMSVAG